MISRLVRRTHMEWLRLSYRTGLDALFFSNGQNGNRVLMFHNIFPETNHGLNMRNLGQRDFRRLLIFIKKNYEIRFADELEPGQNNRRIVAITFDDGLINNLQYALPVLEELEIPATFFISTTWLHGQKITWPDELSLLLQKIPESVLFEGKKFFRSSFNQFRMENGSRLEECLLEKHQPVIDAFLADLRAELKYEPDMDMRRESEWRVMKGEEIKILAASPFVRIGSHAATHRNLCLLDEQELTEELAESRKYLSTVCGKEIDSIAFPFGRWNKEVLETAHRVGYSNCFGVENLHPEILNHQPVTRLGIYNFTPVELQMHAIRNAFS